MAKKVKLFDRFLAWMKRHLFFVRSLLFFLIVILFLMYSIAWGYQQKHKDDPTILGVSFSIKYSKDTGNDWKKNFLALTDDIGIKHFRLMSYWDLGEPERDQYNFEDLDWQFEQAESKNLTVTLALGQKQPRWPECHNPSWTHDLSKEEYEQELLQYIKVVVERYKDSPALGSYQIENEAANNVFGECEDFDRDLYTREINLVKALDPEHPAITNISNQSGIPLRQPVGEKVGYSVYKRAHYPFGDGQNYWSFWYVPSWWHAFRAGLVEGLHGSDVFIHELQAEPWGPQETYLLEPEEQDKTMDSEKLVEIVKFAEQTGASEIYLWGGEWWYYRKEQFKDKELWQTVRDLYDQNYQE